MTKEELGGILEKLGGARAVARALRCGASTVARYARGDRAVPASLAVDLRVLASGGRLDDPA